MTTTRMAAAVVCTAAMMVAGAGAALAHVTVSSPDATAGGYGKLVFRVPTESDSASTVRLAVHLPTDTPFASVSPKQMPGWTVTEQTSKLDKPITDDDGHTLSKAVSEVTWTAAGSGIPPEEFDEFELSVGAFPEDADEMHFPAVQTYSDGTVVKWDEVSAGGAEPEHPAPTLVLAGAATGTSGDNAATTTADKSGAADDSDTTARVLAGAALLIALVGAGLAAMSLRRRPHEQ
jgi:periplasmic copper chaperone A